MKKMTPEAPGPWPDLPYEAWGDTCATLHLWTQVAGKIRLAETPWLNHSWHVPLYVTSRGLSTSPIPHAHRTFEILFDFIDHVLRIEADDGATAKIPLESRTVADFYHTLLTRLAAMGFDVHINEVPNEIPDAIPFSQDRVHAAYDANYAHRFWRVLAETDRVLKHFRTGFIGKCSPVHFFWGSFDLAVTRFSGRRAPPHPGGIPNLPDSVTREAYSHEVSSAGFWPGNGSFNRAAFYSYAYPEPDGFRTTSIRPDAAFYSEVLGEFILPYDAVATASDPDATLLAFLEDTYEAAATTAKWDRAALDCPQGVVRVPRPVDSRTPAGP